MLFVLPLEVPELARELAGKPPLVLTTGGVTGTVPLLFCPLLGPSTEALFTVEALPAPGELLPEEGTPEVSGMGATPLEPLLPPPRLSGAAGVRTSTPLEVPGCGLLPPLLVPEPVFAGMLPGWEVLCLSHPASDSAATRAATPSKEECKMRLTAEIETVGG